MPKSQPGYPLPPGELGEDDITCQLVFFPDRDEYWQAFLGAYVYLCTWRAWERDPDRRGKDAAANWRVALEMTMECWRMACLEQLQEDVSNILKALEDGICCPDMDPTDGDQYTDNIEDGVGDVPPNIVATDYAVDSEDWDGFDDYKCMVSHIVVDSMEAKFRKLAPHVDEAAAVAGGIAAVAIIISAVWTGGLSLLLAGLISSLGGVALFYQAMLSGSALITLSDKIQTNHGKLACAFYQSDGLTSSLASLEDKIDDLFSLGEAILLKNSGMGLDAKALYGGRYDQVNTAQVLEDNGYELADFDCEECSLEVYVENVYGSSLTYDPVTRQYTHTSVFAADCHTCKAAFWVDDTMAERLDVRVQVVSCTNAVTCGGVYHHRHYIWPSTLIYQRNHPDLPEPEDGVIDYMTAVHNASFTLVFKVFSAV